ncbi:MAG: putative DNA-binding domain-containing protein [Gammaproteobacteria bacterium]|nr:putative DNA-binding domain-containing protein [Gammaproteobacteria bacterium]
MPSLPELQRAFAAGVFAEDAAIAQHIHDGRFPAARHLQVYRNNVFESLVGALKAVYPVVERLVGTGFFAYAADSYIRRHPPTSGNLHDFGDSFAGFLAGFEPARELAYLPDVARLEWARHRAFHAADHASLTIERLAAVPPGQYGKLCFKLHPSAQLVASDYPILRIWQVNQPEYTGDTTVNLADGGVRLLVARRELEVIVESLSAGDDALLRAFTTGQRFEDASATALSAQPDYDLAAALRRYVASAVIIDFSIAGDIE